MRTLIATLRWRKHAAVTVKVLPTPDQLRSEECRAKAAECQEIADRWPDYSNPSTERWHTSG